MSSYRCKVRYTIDLFTFEKSIVVEADSPENARDEASYKASEGPPSIYRTDDQGWGGEGWEEVTRGARATPRRTFSRWSDSRAGRAGK